MSQLQVTGEAKIRDIQGPVVANSGVITALDGAASQYVRGDGTLADFPTSTGGGSSVSYYLNSSVSQGTIGGVAYRQLGKTPIAGAGTDITISANGYVASYITDANDPALLEVPAGNFNCEFYFSVNSNNHNPYVYAEVYKYDGTTFTLIGSSQSVPEYLTNGTTLSPYYFAIPVTQTTLAITDRIAIRIYVNVDGRTVTLHTENNHLCQVVTTFSKGLTSLNNLTRQVQFLATGTSGTDFNISSSTATHTFNLPVASATNTGKLSSTDWSTFNSKQPAGNYVTLDTTQTITAAKTFSGVNTFSQNPVINGTGTNSAYTILQSDGTNKWRIGNNYASGVNTFDIFAYDNSSTPLSINSNGAMTLSANVTTTGAQFVQNGFYLTNANGGSLAGYTHMWARNEGINFGLRNGTGGASFIFPSANSYNYTFPAASGTLALSSDLGAYLPLTGGTLTGALSGTSATFSAGVVSQGAYTGFQYNSAGAYPAYNTYFGAIGTNFSNSNSELDIWNTVGGGFVFRKQTGASAQTALLTIASTGAATFSSSVTATSSSFPIDIYGTTNNYGLRINNTGAPTLLLYSSNANANNRNWGIYTNSEVYGDFDIRQSNAKDGDMTVGGNGTSRFYIKNDGNVGIGTSSPTNGKLEIQTTSTTAALWVQTGGTTSASTIVDFRTGSNLSALNILGNGVANFGASVAVGDSVGLLGELYWGGFSSGQKVRAYPTGASGSATLNFAFWNGSAWGIQGTLTSAGVWNTTGGGTSDARTKEDIDYSFDNGIESILKLQPTKFKFKISPNKQRRGFIAQDVLEVIPDLVLGDGEKEDGTYGLDYDGILALAVKAIQEQQAQIEELKALINK
jgi:hypothetical protein